MKDGMTSDMKALTTEEFLERAVGVHGSKYDYSKTVVIKASLKVIIICKKHGEFQQTPAEHLKGCGCRACKYEKLSKSTSMTFDEFKQKATVKHNGAYDYSNTQYVNLNTETVFVCKEHGGFTQTPKNHLAHGCAACGLNKRAKSKTFSLTKVISDFKSVHGDCYDYTNTKYVKSSQPVNILCRTHGEFWQLYHVHMRGSGCPKCASKQRGISICDTYEDFVKKATARHGDKYKYDSESFKTDNKFVEVFCPKHGKFSQRKADHIIGYGCPSCGRQDSKDELELFELVSKWFPETVRRNRTLIGKELDVYIPNKNFAIEYNGLYWHSDNPQNTGNARNRHKEKTLLCKEKGIHLFHLFEDDWLNRKEVVIHTLKHLLGVSEKKVYARQTSVATQPLFKVRGFFKAHHLQGTPLQSYVNYCLYNKGELVAAMVFSKPSSERGCVEEGRYELLRYACKYSVVGGASKLLSAFIKDHKPKSIVSYSDDSMFSGNMYRVLGFVEVGKTKPDYKIIVGKERKHKSGFRREKLEKMLGEKFDKNLSERDNCHANGFYRIYNCGLTKWELVLDET